MRHLVLPLMKEMREAGHEVAGSCGAGSDVDAVRDEGFTVHTITAHRGNSVRAYLAAYRDWLHLFRQESFDIVHVHTPIAAFLARLAAWRAGVPKVVYTVHGFYFDNEQAWWWRAPFLLMEWVAGRVTDVLFSQNPVDTATARRFRLCGGGEYHTIGNGVDPVQFFASQATDPERLVTRAELETSPEEMVILIVARVTIVKGYLELLEAMHNVDAKLWIVGATPDGEPSAQVEEAIDAINHDPAIRDRVSFLGQRTDVSRLLRAADVYVLPSRRREGLPRSVIEAMMTGLPVVSTNIRGPRQLVIDGETGILVPPRDPGALADALKQLVHDPQLRQRMGGAGAARAKEAYVESRVVKRQLELLGLVANVPD